jgi:hypothetical protein
MHLYSRHEMSIPFSWLRSLRKKCHPSNQTVHPSNVELRHAKLILFFAEKIVFQRL